MSEPSDPVRLRVGRKVGRTLYRMVGEEPSDNDELVGLMDTRELADQVVAAVSALEEKDREDENLVKWLKVAGYTEKQIKDFKASEPTP